uniref:Uncharacterized protein n=1 Tax=Vespula pensylvanica TaxID=30213 RepID=A0A834K0I5_VESPE|nr:hypothetical protein H0235_016026 [Vespula pensylvanica]
MPASSSTGYFLYSSYSPIQNLIKKSDRFTRDDVETWFPVEEEEEEEEEEVVSKKKKEFPKEFSVPRRFLISQENILPS